MIRTPTIRTTALFAFVAAAAVAQVTPPPPVGGRGSQSAHKPAAAAAPAAIPFYKDLKYPELAPIVFPHVETVTLPNGMRLILLEDHELPLINGTAMVHTGTLFDPPDKVGLATLTAQLLVEGGIATKPGDAMIRRFEDLGAEIASSATDNSLSISFSTLKESGDEVLDMVKDALLAPEFQQERLDFAKAGLRNAIARRNEDGDAILRREFVKTVYGKTSPYGAQIEFASLDRILRGDLLSFHQRYFFPGNVIFAVEGDFDAAAMKTRLQALFVDWKNEQQPIPEFPKVDSEPVPGKFLAVKKDATQGYFAVGQIGGDFLDKDFPALQIMSDILGNSARGRLNQRLRGLTDSLSVAWGGGFGHPGTFRVMGTINPFRTTQVLQIVYQELNAIRTTEVSEEELKAAKETAVNGMAFAFDGQLSVMPRLTQYEFFNFPKDYPQQYQKALEGITRADVLRVAKEHLDPAKMTTVVVANPATFEAQLETLGSAVTPIDLTIPAPKLAAALGDPASQRKGKELLAKAQQAMGGTDKLAAVTDYVSENNYQLQAASGSTQATMTERWLSPSYLRQDTVLTNGKVSVYSDGKTGWVGGSQSSGPLTGMQLKQVQGDMFRVLFPLLLSDRAPGRKVNALDDNTVEVSDATGQILKLVFDPNTGLLKNVLYDTITASGQLSVIDTYSDYRDSGGMKLPFNVVITVGGQKLQEVTVKNIKVNTGIKLQELEKR